MMSRRASLAVFWSLVCTTIGCSSPEQPPPPPSWKHVSAEIDSLRLARDFDAAVVVASAYVDALRAANEPRSMIEYATIMHDDLLVMRDLSTTALDSLDLVFDLQAEGWKLQDTDYLGLLENARRRIEILDSILPDRYTRVRALALQSLATAHWQLGEIHDAEIASRQLLQLRLEALPEDNPRVAHAMTLVADAQFQQGRYVESEAIQRDAVEKLRHALGETAPQVAEYLRELANILSAKGDVDGALDTDLETMEILRQNGRQASESAGYVVRSIAQLRAEMGEVEEAEKGYAESVRILEKARGPQDMRLCNSLELWGRLELEQGRLDSADSLFTRSLEIREETYGEHTVLAAGALNDLSQVANARGDFDRARDYQLDALQRQRSALGDQHIDVVETRTLLGRNAAARGDLAEARDWLEDAARSYESARIRAGYGLDRATAGVVSPYRSLAIVRLRSGDFAEAWDALEAERARALAEQLGMSPSRSADDESAERERQLRRSLKVLEDRLQALVGSAKADEQEVRRVREQLREEEVGWARFRAAQVVEDDPSGLHPFTLEHVQSRLRSDTAMVGWLIDDLPGAEVPAWAWAMREKGPVSWFPLTRGHSLAADLDELRVALAGVLGVEGRGDLQRWVGRELLTALEPTLRDVDRVEVVLSREMLGMPIETLPRPDGRLLVETHAVCYVPSATVRTILAERSEGVRLGSVALLVGDPPFDERHRGLVRGAASSAPSDGSTSRAGDRGQRWSSAMLRRLGRLPGSRREIAGITPLFERADVLLGLDASEQKLTELAASGRLSEYRYVHFATHALVNDRDPDQSALVLSQLDLPDAARQALAGQPVYDGLLEAREIGASWHLSADLVTLSACETALGRRVQGEGYVGLAQVFLRAGARALLVSLWPVNDEATSLLMQRFYENLVTDGEGSSTDPVLALQRAKNWLRNHVDETKFVSSYDDPHYWAGFILVGESP